MITRIPNLLSADELAQVVAGLAAAKFADGAETAGWHARDVKHNLQLTIGMEGHAPLDAIVRAALLRHPIFQMAVRPRLLMPVMFNRHDPGMTYGPHVDDAVMVPRGSARPMRTDVSFTIFLSDPDSYQGGELVIDGGGGIRSALKLHQGALLAYPSSSLHHVAPITTGTRLAAVGWAQSELRDQQQRAIVFDLDLARREIFARDGKSETFDRLSRSHANLLRLWGEF
jgi:PKHD-type hydroxylase